MAPGVMAIARRGAAFMSGTVCPTQRRQVVWLDWTSFIFPFASYDISSRISHEELTRECQLLERVSCWLLVGFKRGLHSCAHKILAEGMTRIDYLVMSNSFSLEEKIRI